MGDPAQNHDPASETHHCFPRRLLVHRFPAHLRSGLQHDHERSRRAARLNQAAGADDLSDGVFLLCDGLCGCANRRALHHPALRFAVAALDPEGKEMTASAQNKPLPFQNLRPGRIVTWTLLLIGGLIMITPLAFMFSTSLKTAGQVYDLRLIPAEPTLQNYVTILADGRFL